MQEGFTIKIICQNLSLLYVEDDKNLREKSVELFEFLFKKVYVAKDGEDGLQLYQDFYDANQNYIDLVISDIKMPLMDGLNMAKNIYKRNKNQKILITSAYDDKKYLLKLIEMGVEGFLQKPLASEDIKKVLFDVCSKINKEKKANEVIQLRDNYQWDKKQKKLFQKAKEIHLSKSEKALLFLFFENLGENFTALEIFDATYHNIEKSFSQDTIKSLIKRLRKKLPKETITTTPYLGYSINLNY